jgi:hypothetical protein
MHPPVPPPPTVPQKDRAAARLAICLACPRLQHRRKPMERCLACGCMVRAKVLIGSFRCPEGKW